MAQIRYSKRAGTKHLMAWATLMLPVAVHAQQSKEQTLPAVKVIASGDSDYKAGKLSNPKFTEPLVDTPQTISVINKEILREQGAVTLMEALRNTPGITMQLGENGNTSAGDTFQMRGFSTQTATFSDGIRDLGAVTRDVFNLERVEVVKGPAGADIGRGAVSGYINLVSKLPTRDDINSATVSWNTGDNKRLSADFNQKIGETAGLRLNVMAQEGGVDGRDTVENKGIGFAPSFAIGLGTPTRFYLHSQHLRQDNVPDGGIPTIGMEGFFNANASLRAGAKVDRENFYGSKDDKEKVDADMVTAKVEHDLGGAATLRNISRYGRTTMDRVMTGVNTLTAVNANDPSTWTVSRSRQRVDQENEIFANQTSLTTEFATGFVKHSVSTGLELMYERQKNLTFATAAQTINGVAFPAVSIPNANLYDPNADDAVGEPYATGAYVDGSTVTAALYAFDTLKLGERWQVNGGVRFERYNTDTDGRTLVTANNRATYSGYSVGQLAPDSLSKDGNLVTWKVGAVFKPAENGSIYAAYANSKTPPGGTNFALSASGSSAENGNLDPQEATNLELGTKWDLLDKKLALTGAVYRTENTNEVSRDPIDPTIFHQTGKRRVEGVELGLVGQITNAWQVSLGVATMDAEVLEGIASNGTNNAGGGVRWTPELTATLWTSYMLGNWNFAVGGRYVSDQERDVTPGSNSATSNMPEIPSYWVADAMVSYNLTRNASLRLNLYNLFDEEYIGTLNNGGSRMVMGAPRSASLSADFLF